MEKQYTKSQLIDYAKTLGLCKTGTKHDICKRISNKISSKKQINVLIICQRKDSVNLKNELGKRSAKLSKQMAYEIGGMIYKCEQEDMNIEYLVDNTPSNHKVKLGVSDNSETDNFLMKNKNKYDLIMFYTCPLPLMMSMDYGTTLLYDHLKQITKENTKYIICNDDGIVSMEVAYKLLRNRQNKRFANGFKRIYAVIPIYKLM